MSRPQFSLKTMLAWMVPVAAGCVAIRWLGTGQTPISGQFVFAVVVGSIYGAVIIQFLATD